MERTGRSYWDKYTEKRRAEQSRANLRRQRGIGVRRTASPRRRPR